MSILFAIVGATGIGKTNLSLSLAQKYNAEIISVDSRQIYKGFAIGTAQPSLKDMETIPHHLVNFLDPALDYSSGAFCADVKKLVQDSPEKNFILVGGTGFYLQSLMLGLPSIPVIDPSVREELNVMYQKNGFDNLYEIAKSVDPEAVAEIPANNAQRVIRVIEVWNGTGKKLSDLQKHREGGVGLIPIFHLQRSREILYKRINDRVDAMIANGWIEECVSLSKEVPMSAPAWKSLGYRELLNAAQNNENWRAIVEDVKKTTRNFAKRQLTWFRWQVQAENIDLETEKNPENRIAGLIKL